MFVGILNRKGNRCKSSNYNLSAAAQNQAHQPPPPLVPVGAR